MYGYPEKVKEDFRALNDIISRQGSNFVIHSLAEYVGKQNLLWKFKPNEIQNIIRHYSNELKESILEKT